MNKLQTSFIVLGIGIIMFLLQPKSFGCHCDGNPPSIRDAYINADSVFYGVVVKVEEFSIPLKATSILDINRKDVTHTVAGWNMTIRIEKTYKGDSQEKIILSSYNSGCGEGKYEIGSYVLLYANFNKETGAWQILPCGRGSILADLIFLDGLPDNLNRTRIAGKLSQNENMPDKGFSETGVFSGTNIRIAGKNKIYDLKTDANGCYEIFDLPVDEYVITPEIPKGLKILFPMFHGLHASYKKKKNSFSINLKENKSIEVDFLFNANNKISGELVNAKGKPMANFCLDLLPVVDKVSQYFRVFDCTEKDGTFVLDDMPSGKYIIAVEKAIAGHTAFPKFYYPNTYDRKTAKVIDIGEGDVRENFDIRVPSQPETIVVTGMLLYSDNKPVGRRSVEFNAEADQDKVSGDARTITDAQGRFSLNILKGSSGRLYGKMSVSIGQFKDCPDLDRFVAESGKRSAEISTESLYVNSTTNIQAIDLRFPFSSCREK
jgi:hypothetical protein